MRVFKLHINDIKEYDLTKETYKKLTQEREPYVQYFPHNEKNGFAYCPGCNNPIRLVGLYRPIKDGTAAYAKHYEGDVPGIGEYSSYEYMNCKHAVKMRGVCPKEERNPEITRNAKNIYSTIREYLDKAIYILKESTGISFTKVMIEKMLNDYMYSSGYLYPLHTINNIPWMLMYLSDYSVDLYGKCICIDSELYKNLSKIDCLRFDDITFNDGDSDYKKAFAKKYRILKSKEYTEVSVLFQKHHREKISEDQVAEYIDMTIAYRHNGKSDWIYDSTIIITIDDKWFQKIIHSSKAMSFRDKEILSITDKLKIEI